MNIQTELQATLARPIERPADAERAREAAELLGELLRLEDRARRLLSSEAQLVPSGAADLRGMTLHDAAERVLDDAGVPLHAREIGARMKARGWRHPRSQNPRHDQIVFQIAARLPRHPDRFRRVGPNTFALVKWDREGTA